MKEGIGKFLKPTFGKVILSILFLVWQYYYSFQGLRIDFLSNYGIYIQKSLSSFDWNNYFVRNFSLFLVWIVVAVLIFGFIWFFELISNGVHNFRVRRTYSNQSQEDYAHLLKNNLKLFEHFRSRGLWVAGILVTLISLFSLSDLFEKLRYSILDAMMWNAFEEGANIDFYGNNFVIGSFVIFILAWYLVSAVIIWIFEEQKNKEDEEKISADHFAVAVDTNPEENEDDEEDI